MWNRVTYSIVFYLLLPIIYLYFLWRAIKSPGYREGFLQRLGIYTSTLPDKPVIHCHCASLGESKAIVPLLKQLIVIYPSHHFVVTTTTPTGAGEIRTQFGEQVEHCYAPMDTLGAVAGFYKHYAPIMSLFVEVELWPNWLAKLKKNGTKTVLINGRLSLESFQKYLKHTRLMTPTIQCFDQLIVQYKADAERFVKLGASEQCVHQVGNLKFDLELPEAQLEKGLMLKEQIGQRKVWIAASTHQGEHELVLKVHKKILQSLPNSLLVIVPRHPEQFDYTEKCIKDLKLNYVTRSSEASIETNHQVLLGNTMGEMFSLMSIAQVAFVGGSWVKTGGHNPLEPAALGIPILMGPHINNIRDIAQDLVTHKAMQQFQSGQDFYTLVTSLLQDGSKHKKASDACLGIMSGSKGGIAEALKYINAVMKQT